MVSLIERVNNPDELWQMAELAHKTVNAEYTQEALSNGLKTLLQ